MRRISKVIALCLLLSIAVSVFAVFSFGADATMSPTVVYDMEKKLGTNGASIKDATDMNGEPSLSMLYKTDANGKPYYQHRVPGVYDEATGQYKNPNTVTNVYYQASPTGSAVIVDSDKYGPKNTDFFIIDFDFSTDGTFGDYFYFQNRWYNEAGGNSQDHYPRLDGGTIDEGLTIHSATGGSTPTSGIYSLDKIDNTGWVDITLIYDFRGQDRTQWKAYAYLNGQFAGEIGTVKSDAVRFYFSRFVYDTTFAAPAATANLANFTIKSFPVDYNGELATEVANLGKNGVELGSFSDLGYCLADKPTAKVATVERGDEVIEVHTPNALDASLIDGDKVTLYADITKPLIVPKGANITWETNGRFMVPVHEVDYSEVNVVLRDLKTGQVLGYANDPVTGITTLYNQNAAAAPDAFKNNNTTLAYAKETDEYGRVYWTLGAPDATNLDTRGPWHALGWGGTYVPTENINYVVFDVDIKPGANSFKQLDYNLRFSNYNEATEKYASVTASSALFSYYIDNGKVGVRSGDNKTKYFATSAEGAWTHITVVYDLCSADNADWRGHAYIDGQYAGVVANGFNAAQYMYFVRFQPLAAEAADATTSFANWSVKRFDSTYNGNLADRLANTAYALSDIADLAYCMENDMDEAPEEDNTPIVGITTKFDQQTASKAPSYNKSAKYTAYTDAYGRVYWTVSAPDATALPSGGSAYWHPLPGVSAISIADTNYLVFDIDIKPGEHTFSKFYYNVRFNKDSTEDFYYLIEDGKIGIQSESGVKYLSEYTGEWAHLTVIYDFTASSYSGWKAYVYVDGVFLSETDAAFTSAFTTLNDIRFQIQPAGYADAKIDFANWTAKVFDNTYNGKLGTRLANTEYTLAEISDLAYCLENVIGTEPPATPDEEPEEEKPADVETTSLYEALSTYAELYNLRATLLNDATLINAASVGVGKRIVFDLGGKTLTTKAVAGGTLPAHSFALSGTILFNNGKLVDQNDGNANVIYIGQYSANAKARAIFRGVDILVDTNHPLVEARQGVVSFEDCEINAEKAAFLNMRGGNVYTGVVVKNSVVTASGSAIAVANTSAESKRHGSLNTEIVIENSTVSAVENIISVKAYANEVGKVSSGAFVPDGGYGDNNNVVNVAISGSTLTAGGAVIYSEIADIRNDAYDLDGDSAKDVIYADNFKLVTNTKISDTVMTAVYMAQQHIADAGMLPATFAMARSAAAYTHTTNIDLDTVNVSLLKAHAVKNVPTSADEINITYAGESALSTNKSADVEGTLGVSLETESGYYLVPRSAAGVAPYAVTTNVTPYPYIIDGNEYEFYWYGDDPVDTALIPVDITTNSPYVSFEWADGLDENGAYFLETVVTVPLKANMTLGASFGFNLYLPADMTAETYNTVRINGERVPVANVTIDGVDYKVVTISDISPVNATEAFDLSFTVYTEDGLSASATKRVSILDYAKGILKSTTEGAESKELIASLVNYIAKVYAADGRSDDALAAVLALDEYKAITLTKATTATAKSTIDALGVFETVGLTAGGDFRLSFRTVAGFNGNLVFTYYKNGQRFMETVMVRGGDIITLDVKAYDLLSDITVRYNGAVGEYNLAAYIEALAEMEADVEMLELADALWIFAERAVAYKTA